ncbi:MAG TPA: hypothetical protein VLV56_13170 [Burkholderiales bacterium]|nr:hypothetical protein [Burkholderiales bacterium]
MFIAPCNRKEGEDSASDRRGEIEGIEAPAQEIGPGVLKKRDSGEPSRQRRGNERRNGGMLAELEQRIRHAPGGGNASGGAERAPREQSRGEQREGENVEEARKPTADSAEARNRSLQELWRRGQQIRVFGRTASHVEHCAESKNGNGSRYLKRRCA